MGYSYNDVSKKYSKIPSIVVTCEEDTLDGACPPGFPRRHSRPDSWTPAAEAMGMEMKHLLAKQYLILNQSKSIACSLPYVTVIPLVPLEKFETIHNLLRCVRKSGMFCQVSLSCNGGIS
jgi:hypothetical protein